MDSLAPTADTLAGLAAVRSRRSSAADSRFRARRPGSADEAALPNLEVMEMKLRFQSKPKSLANRADAAVGDFVDFARSVPERLDGPRERALAVVGAVAGVAAGLAFWRSRTDHGPSVHHDPARPPTPWKSRPPTQRPPERSDEPATDTPAAEAVGSRSK